MLKIFMECWTRWCPTHIVLCFCFVLVMCMVVSYTYCIVCLFCPRYMYGGLYILYYVFCFVLVMCMVVSNTYCVVYFVLFVFVLCLVHGGVQHILCYVFCFVCLHLVSCVWWCPAYIVLCFFVLFVFILCMMVSSIYCVVFFVLFVFRLVICVPNVANFSGLAILECPLGFSKLYYSQIKAFCLLR